MSSRMRTVSFVERLEFEFAGNLFNQTVVLGDVDNDLGNELVVGNINGYLAIFKGTEKRPWRKTSDLGMITCVGIGDVCNKGRNFLISHSAEGWLYIFDVKPDRKKPQPDSEKAEGSDAEADMKPYHHQHLPANSKVMLIADIDGDDQVELVIGYSDRVVRTYRWYQAKDTEQMLEERGKFIPLNKWQLAAQIGAISVTTTADGSCDLMVAQPGGTYVSLLGHNRNSRDGSLGTDCDQSDDLCFHPLASSRTRNPSVTTEIVGGINKKGLESKAKPSAVCTLDGTLMLIQEEKILWSFQVDHQLFGLTKLDFTGDGEDEVIVCSWDGQTYIINHDSQVVRFQFEEDVAAFCAGNYAVSNGKNIPCLVYITFNNKIYMYINIRMPHIQSTNLVETMEAMPETSNLLQYFNIDTTDPAQLKRLYHWCLYGKHKT